MSITEKIIVTDTNIITDLNNANILDKFVGLDNVYISDLVKNDEVNSKTGDLKIIDKFKTLRLTDEQLIEVSTLSCKEAIKACILLKECQSTRIPEEDINNLITEFKTGLVIV